MKPDYSWQARCVDAVLTSLAGGNRDFLVNATPGAGKTTMTSKLARQMFKSDAINFVVVIAPSGNVCANFVKDMGTEGITLKRIESGSELRAMLTDGIGTNVQGFCLTAGMLLANAGDIAKLIKLKRVLHVSDEAHHNGEELEWGKAALAVSDEAVLRLGLSGTPYRSDNERIPFLHYDENGESVPQFNFTFEEAQDAGLITDIHFESVGGFVGVLNTKVSKKVIRYDFSDDLDDDTATRRLNFALDHRSPYLLRLVEAADIELQRIRETEQPNAGGIVFASSGAQAKQIARMLRHMKRSVRLVIEDADASAEVDKFNASTDDWVVQIRMVYEGSNIPRLRVGVWATNWLTEGFFHQACGRLMRRLPDVDPKSMPAYMFIPADDRLDPLTDGIGIVHPHIVDESVIDGRRKAHGEFEFGNFDTYKNRGYFEIVDGDAYLTFVLVDGRKYTADDLKVVDAYLAANFPKLAKHSTSHRLYLYASLEEAGKL